MGCRVWTPDFLPFAGTTGRQFFPPPYPLYLFFRLKETLMQSQQCDIIGCPETAAWVRSAQKDEPLEEFLCNGCWLKLCATLPEQAASYIVLNVELATPQVCPHHPGPKQKSIGDVIVIK
jgi:hypothetical protein